MGLLLASLLFGRLKDGVKALNASNPVACEVGGSQRLCRLYTLEMALLYLHSLVKTNHNI